jgi:hypothetical protein
MTTTIQSAALVPAGPAFSDQERLALAGYLAGYSGLTREAYALDLRQFATWCATHSVCLFQVRHTDIEHFGRDLEARGRARATITRRLCTIAGFYRYADVGTTTGMPWKRSCWITPRRSTCADREFLVGLRCVPGSIGMLVRLHQHAVGQP